MLESYYTCYTEGDPVMTQPVAQTYCDADLLIGTFRRVARIPTKPRPIRMTDELWARALKTAEEAGENLPDRIREYVAWYARVPGARPPARPPARQVSDQ